MANVQDRFLTLVRRSKLFVPVNREKFVAKAWTRGADVIILDLEDAIAPSDKASARKMVKDVIPVVNKGGAEVQVRFNRDYEEEDLDAIVIPGLDGLMIPKPESAEEIQKIDRLVTRLEKERGLPAGKIYFDLIVETAAGVVKINSIAKASPRITQMNIGQGDLSVSMGFPRFIALNFEQYFYAENALLFAARAAACRPTASGRKTASILPTSRWGMRRCSRPASTPSGWVSWGPASSTRGGSTPAMRGSSRRRRTWIWPRR